ncbi:hypothetical protein WDU94_015538 [Cyamophila willieti]
MGKGDKKPYLQFKAGTSGEKDTMMKEVESVPQKETAPQEMKLQRSKAPRRRPEPKYLSTTFTDPKNDPLDTPDILVERCTLVQPEVFEFRTDDTGFQDLVEALFTRTSVEWESSLTGLGLDGDQFILNYTMILCSILSGWKNSLFTSDFDVIYKELTLKFPEKFVLVKSKILELLHEKAESQKRADPVLDALVSLSTIGEEQADAACFLAIPHLLSRMHTFTVKDSRTPINPSRNQVSNSFLPKVNTSSDILEYRIQREANHLKYKEPFIPFVVAVGQDWQSIQQYDLILSANVQYSFTQADFSQIYQLPLVDDQLSFFYDTFLLLFNSHFPYKTASVGRKRRKEWITKGIRVSSENKRSLFNLSLHTSDPSFLSYYHTYCRILKKVVKEAKGSYTVQQIKRAPKQKKIKTIWNVIKSHSKYNKKATADPFKIKIGNTQIQNPIAVANTFNNFWINVAKEIINSQSTSSSSSSHTRLSSSNHSSSSSSLPPTSSPNFSTPSTSSYSSSAFLPPSNLSPTLPPPSSSYPTLPPSFTLAPCSPIEILKIVGGLQNKTSCGEDDIPMTVIKKVIHVIAGPLSFIFNSSFSTSTFPKLFKNAIITPVHKGKGAMTDLNSFRPISLLNNFAKILEKLVAYRISTYLEHHNLLVEQQFGFRHGRSTSDAVAHFIQKLDIILASGQQAIGIFCDLTKAFDCVDHALLLSKLPTFGIRGTALLWIQSYLSNRQQKVKVPSCSAPSVTPNTTLNTSSSTSLLNSNLPPSPTHPSPSLPLPSSVHLNHQFSSVSPYHVSRSTSQPALSIPSSPVPTTSILPITSHSLPNIPPPNNSPRLPYISSQPYSQYMFPCVAQYSPNPPHPFPPSLTTSSPLIPPLTSKPNSPSVSTSTPFHPPAAAY